MAVVNLDLALLFENAFGYRSPAFNPKIDNVSGDNPFDRVEKGELGSAYYATDLTLGVKYFMPVKVEYPDTTQLTADEQALLGSTSTGLLNTWYFPFPLISMAMRKRIIETDLTEKRGTVKEYINTKDYEISIKGLIIAATNDYPEADVTKMRDIFSINQPIIIHNPLTDKFLLGQDRKGSKHVVITELSFPGNKGVKNVVPYELKMLSDEPFDLIDIGS